MTKQITAYEGGYIRRNLERDVQNRHGPIVNIGELSDQDLRRLTAPDDAPATTPAGPACRVCGCTQENACVDPDHGPCWWVEPDLCSHCGEPKIVAAAYDRLVSEIGQDGMLTPAGLAMLFDWTKRARAALAHVDRIECDLFDL